MNLRVIKKDLEYFIGEFIDDCLLFDALNPSQDHEASAKIIDRAVDLFNDLKDKINHPEGEKKAWYRAIYKEMFEKLDELCESLSSVISK